AGRAFIWFSKPRYRARPDYDLILNEIAFQLLAVGGPPLRIQVRRHDFHYNDVIMHHGPSGRVATLRGRAGEGGDAPEMLGELFANSRIHRCLEMLPVIVGHRKEDFDEVHSQGWTMVRNVTHADHPACIHRQQDIERFVPTFGDTSTETTEKFANASSRLPPA